MRIVLTVHQFFPTYRSGTEVLTLSVARELKRRGHEVIVFAAQPASQSLADAERFTEDTFEDIPVVRFHHSPGPMGRQRVATELEFRNELVASYFVALLRRYKPDVVHFFHFGRLGAAMVDAAVQEGVRRFYTATDFWAICPMNQLLLPDGRACPGPTARAGNCVKHIAELSFGSGRARLLRMVPNPVADVGVAMLGLLPAGRLPMQDEIVALDKRVGFNRARLDALDAIVAPTRTMADALIRNGVQPGKVHLHAFGIDLKSLPDVQSLPQVGQGPLKLGFIGTLSPHKGCHVLIEAIRRLPVDRVQLVIYGGQDAFPDYVAQLRRLAEGCGNVQFLGTFANEEISRVLAALDVVVLPSIWLENAPLVMQSALAARRPVIASDFPGLSEMIEHGRNGLLFRPGDVDDLARCIMQIAEDPDLLRHLAEGCERPKSVETYVEELLALYQQADATATPSPAIASFPRIEPWSPGAAARVVGGWAMVDFTSPRCIAALSAGTEIASTREFSPRDDVRDSLRRSGVSIDDRMFGFRLEVAEETDTAQLVLRIVPRRGQAVDVPLSRVATGTSIEVARGTLIGIDRFDTGPRDGGKATCASAASGNAHASRLD